MEYYIVVFKNTLDAMKAEKELTNRRIAFKMMPTPTAITQSCGLCVRIEREGKNNLDNIRDEKFIEYKNIYQKKSDGFWEVC